jgi:hypothetical protein
MSLRAVPAGVILLNCTGGTAPVPVYGVAVVAALAEVHLPVAAHGEAAAVGKGEAALAAAGVIEGGPETRRSVAGHALHLSMDDSRSEAACDVDANAIHAYVSSEAVAARAAVGKREIVAAGEALSAGWVHLLAIGDVCAAANDPHSPADTLQT